MRDRRSFLISSAAALAAASFPSHLFAERRGGEVFTNASLAPYAQGLMNPATFENVIGDIFTMFVENNGIAYLRLEHVVDFNNPRAVYTPTTPHTPVSTARIELASPAKTTANAKATVPLIQFALSFTLAGDSFDSGVYLVDHGRLGRFALSVINGSVGRASATFCLFDSTSAVVLPKLH